MCAPQVFAAICSARVGNTSRQLDCVANFVSLSHSRLLISLFFLFCFFFCPICPPSAVDKIKTFQFDFLFVEMRKLCMNKKGPDRNEGGLVMWWFKGNLNFSPDWATQIQKSLNKWAVVPKVTAMCPNGRQFNYTIVPEFLSVLFACHSICCKQFSISNFHLQRTRCDVSASNNIQRRGYSISSNTRQ